MVDFPTLLSGQLLGGVWRLDEQHLRTLSSQAWLFNAYDGRTGERAVVKVFKPERASDFDCELRALRRLASGRCSRVPTFRSQGLVVCAGVSLPFIAMGLAEGLPLDKLVPAAHLDLDDRLELLAQIAEALAEVHAQLIVHRDVKPANVVVRVIDVDAAEPAAAFSVKLVDFGLATILDDAREARLGAAEGTLAYMSPDREVTLAADIYAFGRLARDLLSHHSPRGPLSAAEAVADIQAALPASSTVHAAEISAVLCQCLSDRPEHRAPNAIAVAERLRPLIAPRAGRTYPRLRALRLWRRAVCFDHPALDERRTLDLLYEWITRFVGSTILAALAEEQRTRALERLAAGEHPTTVVHSIRSAVPLRGALAEECPAVRAALSFWSLRVTRDALELIDSSQLDPQLGDSTWLPRTLIEYAGDCLKEGTPDERAAVIGALVTAIATHPFFTEFTLARWQGSGERPRLTISSPRGRDIEWSQSRMKVKSEAEPLLVKLDGDGGPVADVEPWSIAPFALLDGDGRDLLFFSGSASRTARFTTPFSIRTAPVPQQPPYSIAESPPSTRASRHPTASFTASVPCVAPPVLEIQGRTRTYFLTAADEWFALEWDGGVSPVRKQIGSCAAALDDLDNLIVASYEPTIARFGSTDWEYLPRSAPVLSLYRSPVGLVVGDAAGVLEMMTNEVESRRLEVGVPVLAISGTSDGALVFLGSDGSLRATRWPQETSVNVLRLGNPPGRSCGLFAARPGLCGVFSATRIALVDVASNEIVALSDEVAGGVRNVQSLSGQRETYAVLGDDGTLLLLDAALGVLTAVRLPRTSAPVVGARATRRGGLLIWTLAGELYSLDAERTLRRLAAEGVSLAFNAGDAERLVLVRFNPSDGAQIEVRAGKDARS